MEITEVKVFPVREEKVKAFVSIILDRCFMVNDIKIIQGRDGLFISMPSRRKRNGKFKDVAHPLNNETRSRMEKRILGEYERALGNGGAEATESATPLGPPEPDESVGPSEAADAPPDDGAARKTAQPEEIREAAGDAEPQQAAEAATDDRTLAEVAAEHLKDSFWTT